MAAYEHPHADEMRALVMRMTTRRDVQARFVARLERLLAHYAEHDRFVKEALDVDLRRWVQHTYTACHNNAASGLTVQLFKLLDMEGLFKRYKPRAHTTQMLLARRKAMRAAPAPEVVKSVFETFPEFRTRLLAMEPTGMEEPENEDRADTIWWHRLREWQARVAAGEGVYVPELMPFIELAQDMRRQGALEPAQLDVMALLERPYKPTKRRRTVPHDPLELVGG